MITQRRTLLLSTLAASIALPASVVWAQAGKAAKKLTLGQSVPLTGAADQIGLAYFNGAKMFFDVVTGKSAKHGDWLTLV